MTLRQNIFTLAGLLAFTTMVQASMVRQLDELVATLPPGSVHGIAVRGADSGEQVYTRNAHYNLLPASIIKSITAITAYQVLGADFRFQTKISSQCSPISRKIYTGDLVLSFSGDPSLTHEDIDQLIVQLKKSGIKEVHGNFWLDSSVYSGYPRAGGTIWDDRNICFAAPAGAIILDRNCFFGWLNPAIKKGAPAKMEYDHPEWQIRVDNRVITRGPKNSEPLGCLQEVWPSNDYEYRLEGCIRPGIEPMRMAFSVADVERSTRRYVKTRLKSSGIKLKGRILTGKPEGEFNYILASHQSQPLPVLLQRVLEKSDNIYSDSILKTIGAKDSGLSGSYYLGTQAVRRIMQEQGVLLERARLVDGSGLSRYNRISSEDMVQMLRVGWKLWGEDAPWLANRDKPERWLKTGYMSGVNNMVGYVFPEKGEPLVFSLMLNGLRVAQPAESDQIRSFHNEVREFRRTFLKILQK